MHLLDLGAVYGTAINNTGQVALATPDPSGGLRGPGWIYTNGTLTPLPGLPGSVSTAVPLAINDNGQVVGTADGAIEFCTAVLYSGGVLTDIGVPFGNPGLDCAAALGINSAGVVVGWSAVSRDFPGPLGFIYDAGDITTIDLWPGLPAGGTLLYGSSARDINDSGQITGLADSPEADDRPTVHGFIYLNGTWTDLGRGRGNKINNQGQVTGALELATGSTTTTHILLYSNGSALDLGTLPGGTASEGLGINGTGQVVGKSDLAGASQTHAVFYNGLLIDLNTVIDADDPLKPYVTLTDATAINNSRLIVTNGTDSRDGKTHAYLLQGPRIDIAPGLLAFDGTAVGAASSSKPIRLTNSSTQAVTLGMPAASAGFTQTTDCGTSLPAQATCTLQVKFAPVLSGDITGSLTFTSDTVPFSIPLSGAAPLSVTINASPSSVAAGAPTKLGWTLTEGSSCTATGGASGDGWTGAITASGSRSVTESKTGSYKYGLSCTAGSQSGSASVAVTVTDPPKSGGGSVGILELLALCGGIGLRTRRRAGNGTG